MDQSACGDGEVISAWTTREEDPAQPQPGFLHWVLAVMLLVFAGAVTWFAAFGMSSMFASRARDSAAAMSMLRKFDDPVRSAAGIAQTALRE